MEEMDPGHICKCMGLYRISYVCLHKQDLLFRPLLRVPNLQGSSDRLDWNVPFSKCGGSSHINKP